MVVFLLGVCGSGKSTLLCPLADVLTEWQGLPKDRKWIPADADVFHSEQNKKKMNARLPLSDEDRENWVQSLERYIIRVRERSRDMVLGFSGLRRTHRARLREAAKESVSFLLTVEEVELYRRLEFRFHNEGHFMPPELLQSQLATFESVSEDESIIPVNGNRPLASNLGFIASQLFEGRLAAPGIERYVSLG